MNVFINLEVGTAGFAPEQVVESVTKSIHEDILTGDDIAILEEVENVTLIESNLQFTLGMLATEMSIRFATAVAVHGFKGSAKEFFEADLEGDLGEMLYQAFEQVCGD